MNWRGRSLTSHKVIVQTIAATTTGTGLRVHAELDPGSYPDGVKVNDAQMDTLPLTRHDWHGDWNCTLHPHEYDPARGAPDPFGRPGPDLAWLCHPALTGRAARSWDSLIATLVELPASSGKRTCTRAAATRGCPPPAPAAGPSAREVRAHPVKGASPSRSRAVRMGAPRSGSAGCHRAAS
jgi:hypothetical protein